MTDGLHTVATPDRLGDLPDGIARLGAEAWGLTRPDLHLVQIEEGRLAGRLSAWASGPEAGTGCLGHAAWEDPEAGQTLIEAGCAWLAERGVRTVLGPLDGSTWFSYRVVTESDGSPPFRMEPTPAPSIAEAFAAAGFSPVAHYLSSRVDALPDLAAEAEAARARLGDAGVTVRPFRLDAAEAELRALYPLLLRAFADNLYYTPLDEARFLAAYGALLPLIHPRLVLIAERDGAPVAVVLAYPDADAETVVVKTLAVHPEAQGAGLGGALALLVQAESRSLGRTRAIHALMHADNASVRISGRLGTPFRRYALLGRALDPR